MEFQEFLRRLRILSYGVVAFNTYDLKGEQRCYLMVAQKGDVGEFIKVECRSQELNETFDTLITSLSMRG